MNDCVDGSAPGLESQPAAHSWHSTTVRARTARNPSIAGRRWREPIRRLQRLERRRFGDLAVLMTQIVCSPARSRARPYLMSADTARLEPAPMRARGQEKPGRRIALV